MAVAKGTARQPTCEYTRHGEARCNEGIGELTLRPRRADVASAWCEGGGDGYVNEGGGTCRPLPRSIILAVRQFRRMVRPRDRTRSRASPRVAALPRGPPCAGSFCRPPRSRRGAVVMMKAAEHRNRGDGAGELGSEVFSGDGNPLADALVGPCRVEVGRQCRLSRALGVAPVPNQTHV